MGYAFNFTISGDSFEPGFTSGIHEEYLISNTSEIWEEKASEDMISSYKNLRTQERKLRAISIWYTL